MILPGFNALPASSLQTGLSKQETMTTACPLFEQVQGALTGSPYFAAKQFRVQTNQGTVRLEGTVGSFYQKQMAQELVRRLDGVQGIENQLQVSWS